ncbi:MAG: TonB-dependent receptor, partial [Massilibacteroides sp.]|nr:TonB-dependent receptor [Massilibacteroides sp.]
MKHNFVFLFCFFALGFTTMAQQVSSPLCKVEGVVLDSLTQKSIPYATLRFALLSSPDKSVKILACNEEGAFKATLKTAIPYRVTIASLGMKTKIVSLTLPAGKPNYELGAWLLTELNQQLGEVTVTAQKPLVKVEIDKLTYNLKDDPESKTNNVLEMLRKVPLVTVDGQDKIELKGSSNYKIYINGKPSNLLSNNPSIVLRSMPASSVKEIEVITDPGAKYDAEGIGGIINIITEKNAMQGYTVTLNANADSHGGLGGGTYASSKIGKVGITANYNYNDSQGPWMSQKSLREGLDAQGEVTSTMRQEGRNKNSGPFQYGYLEFSYEIDSLNLFSVGGNHFKGHSDNTSEQEVSLLYPASVGATNQLYNQKVEGFSEFGNTSVNVDFQHATQLKDELLTFSYRFFHSPNNSKADLALLNPSLVERGYEENTVNDAATSEHTGQIDYTRPTWKGQTLETGLKYIYRANDSETQRRRRMNGESDFSDISAPENDFSHQQHIYSIYMGYRLKWDKIGLKLGTRGEGTSLNVTYANAPSYDFSTHYFDVVPNVALSYMIKPGEQVKLSYSMRINRPGIWYLNPYVNNSDPLNISYGNPNLDSEKAHKIGLTYNMFARTVSLNASLNYSFVNNGIQQYTFIDPTKPEVAQKTFDNIGKTQKTNLFVYGNWKPFSFLSLGTNASIEYLDMKSEANQWANSGFSGRIYGNAQIFFPADLNLSFWGGYFGRRLML